MVHRATFTGTGEFEEETEYEREGVILECFPPEAGNKLLLIFDKPPRTFWSFPIVESERHDDKEERIKGGAPDGATGESEAVIEIYKVPATDNEARFKAEFTLGGVNWRVKFRGNQTFPL